MRRISTYQPSAVYVADEPARVIVLALVGRRSALWAGVLGDKSRRGSQGGGGQSEDGEGLHFCDDVDFEGFGFWV
jgi:hypothetical protein